jgi:hypothetical protein
LFFSLFFSVDVKCPRLGNAGEILETSNMI